MDDRAPPIEAGSQAWAWAEQIWEYHHMGHDLEGHVADGILVLCSHGLPGRRLFFLGGSGRLSPLDLRVADHAAALFREGRGRYVVFSGGFGTGPHSGANLNGWTAPEAEVFAARAAALGVPADAIHVESEATNTGENCRLSRALLEARGLPRASLVVVQKPFMERRSYATLLRQWGAPVPAVRVTSPPASFAGYPDAHISREVLVSIMVGDLQRLRLYATPARDFQIPMDIPPAVWAAYEGLRDAGYDGNVIRD